MFRTVLEIGMSSNDDEEWEKAAANLDLNAAPVVNKMVMFEIILSLFLLNSNILIAYHYYCSCYFKGAVNYESISSHVKL